MVSSSSLILFAQELVQLGFSGGLPPWGGAYTVGKFCGCNFQMLEWGIVEAANPSTMVCVELPKTMFSPMLCGKMNSNGRFIGL